MTKIKSQFGGMPNVSVEIQNNVEGIVPKPEGGSASPIYDNLNVQSDISDGIDQMAGNLSGELAGISKSDCEIPDGLSHNEEDSVQPSGNPKRFTDAGCDPPAMGGRLADSGFIRQSQLIPDIIPISPATLWREVKSGAFPAPVKLSPGVTAWRVEDVRAWINSREPVIQ